MGFLEYAFKSEAGVILIVDGTPDVLDGKKELEVYAGPLNKLKRYAGNYIFSKSIPSEDAKEKSSGVYIDAYKTDGNKFGALLWKYGEQAEMYYDDGHAEHFDLFDPVELPQNVFAYMNAEIPRR